MYVCTYVYVHVAMYKRLYVCPCTNVQMCMHICISCMYVCIYAYANVYDSMCIDVWL